MINLRDMTVVNMLVSEIESSEELDRKEQAFNAYQVYSGNTREYVQDELQRIRPVSWSKYYIADVSLSKMVNNKLACAYKEQPERKVSEEDVKNDRMSDIYREAGASDQFRELDLGYNLYRHELVWVNYRETEARYQFMTLAPYEYSVVRNKDTGDLEAVVLSYPDQTITQSREIADGVSQLIAEAQADSGGHVKVYAMWSKDHHVIVKVKQDIVQTPQGNEIKKSIDYIENPDNPNQENPIGVIPFVYISKDNSPDYPTINPITNQSINYATMFSELLTASAIQGVGQLVFKYPERMQGAFDNLNSGLTTAIELPQSSKEGDASTDVDYISPNPQLGAQMEVYTTYLRQVLSEHGITSSQGLDGTVQSFSSGLERLIAQADVQSVIELNQQKYIWAEKQIFEIIKKWEVFLGNTAFSEEDELTVVFKKPKITISEKEVIANIKELIMLGLIDEVKALTILDPNLSETEAEEELNKMNVRMGNQMRGFMNADQSGQDFEVGAPQPGQSTRQ